MYFDCVCRFRYAACNAHALYYHVACPALKNNMIFEKKIIDHKMCVLIFSTTLPETVPILRKCERDMIRNAYRSSRKVLFILVRF